MNGSASILVNNVSLGAVEGKKLKRSRVASLDKNVK
jgi:hypothetical protein